MPLLKIDNLSFTYALSDRPAVSSLSLELSEGDFVLLCGPSGCGKSTLLRQIKRELTPAGARQGDILYMGRPLAELTPLQAACDIGLVMQSPDSQLVTGNVMSELSFGLENLGFERDVIRRRVAEMASFFGIASWFDKDTDSLSGGQKQIVNLAAALAMQPRLLLLDEPTAQLDPVAARELIEMVARLNRELGITVLMTEHRLEEIMPLADRVLIMEQGRLRFAAAPRELGEQLMTGRDLSVKEYRFTVDAGSYLRYLPAATRIFYGAGYAADEPAPLTVSEGRAFVRRACGGFTAKSVKAAKAKTKIKDAQPPVAECDGVYFGYDKDRDILRDLNFEAYSGELLCVFGQNGSGKSTLLNLLAGILKPRRGSVRLDGRDLRRLKDRELYRSNIALLPQSPKALFLYDTLAADLAHTADTYGAKIGGADEIAPLAERLGIGGLLSRHPYDLSGGEQQKAALLKILLTHPRLMLLDEPTKGLDAEARQELAQLMRGLCDEGKTIIVISHDIEFAAQHADRCLLLSDGAAACADIPARFFGGNYFYTTAANRIARDIDWSAITCEEVIELCKKAGR